MFFLGGVSKTESEDFKVIYLLTMLFYGQKLKNKLSINMILTHNMPVQVCHVTVS